MAEKVNVECDESGNPYVIKADGKKYRLYQKGPTFGLKTSVAPRGHGKFLIEFNPRTNKLVCKPKSANDKIKGAKYQMYLRNGLLICRRTLPAGAKAPKEKDDDIEEEGSQTAQMAEAEFMTNGEPMEVVAEEQSPPIAASVPVPMPIPVPMPVVAAPAAKKAPPKAAAKKAPSAKPKAAGAAKKAPAKKVAKK